MTVKNTALVALVAMVLLTIVVLITLFRDVMAVTGGVLAPVSVVRTLIEAFAAIAVTLFFYALHRHQA